MHSKLLGCIAAVTFAAPAFADDQAAANMDMHKMGPMTALPKHEAQDKKELSEWFKAHQEIAKKGDVEGMADMVDFPVMMMSQSSKGEFKTSQVTREQFIAMMKPMMDPEKMKGTKMSHSGTCAILSDDLASCEGVTSMEMGKMKGKYNSQAIMVRVGGKWKTKTMLEAGWGDMNDQQGAGGSGNTGNGAATPPKK